MGKAKRRHQLSILSGIGGYWDGISAQGVLAELKAAGEVEEIEVLINSPGGSAVDAVAIYNALKTHAATVTVRVLGWAASAASIVAMAGDRIVMEEGTFLMIHQAWGMAVGTAAELRDTAVALEKISGEMAGIYGRRSGRGEAVARGWMDGETWFTAKEAVAAGLADEAVAGDDGAVAERIAAHAGRVREMFGRLPAGAEATLSAAGNGGEAGEASDQADQTDRTDRDDRGVDNNEPASAGGDDERRDSPMGEKDTKEVQGTDGQATEPAAPKAATLAEIKAACPEAPAEFTLRMLEAKASAETVKAAWAERRAALAEAKAAAAPAEPKGPTKGAAALGVKPLASSGTAGEDEGDPVAAWNAAVAAEKAQGKAADAAVKAANKANPGLREAMLSAVNAR